MYSEYKRTTAKNPNSPSTSAQASDIVVQKVDKDDVRDIIREEKMLAPDVSESELSFSAVGGKLLS